MARCYAAFGKCHGMRFSWSRAYDTENGLVLSQKATPNKKGEIETVKDMLDILELVRAVVTLDALHCQRETLEKISEKKAHVVVQVKNNQPKLYQAVQSQFQSPFDAQKEKIVVEHKESGHGRQGRALCVSTKAKLPPELTEKRPTIRQHHCCWSVTAAPTEKER